MLVSVVGDGAYDTKGCYAAIASREAEAIMLVRKNGKPWKENTAGALVRNEALRATKYLWRALWKNWSGYHRRTLVETKMRCFKLLGERVMSRDFLSSGCRVARPSGTAEPFYAARDTGNGARRIIPSGARGSLALI